MARPAARDERLLDYLRARRSVPAAQLTWPGPDHATLADMLTIAARVPDHGKLAPWRFVVFEGPARERAGELMAALRHRRDGIIEPDELARERERFARAPVVVAVISTAAPHAKIPEWEQVLSAGCVALNLLHAARAHGFAANWLTEWVAYDEDAKAALGIARNERVAAFVHIGTPTIVPTDRVRPDVEAITTRFPAR